MLAGVVAKITRTIVDVGSVFWWCGLLAVCVVCPSKTLSFVGYIFVLFVMYSREYGLYVVMMQSCGLMTCVITHVGLCLVI